jgi:hypothetical protein
MRLGVWKGALAQAARAFHPLKANEGPWAFAGADGHYGLRSPRAWMNRLTGGEIK